MSAFSLPRLAHVMMGLIEGQSRYRSATEWPRRIFSPRDQVIPWHLGPDSPAAQNHDRLADATASNGMSQPSPPLLHGLQPKSRVVDDMICSSTHVIDVVRVPVKSYPDQVEALEGDPARRAASRRPPSVQSLSRLNAVFLPTVQPLQFRTEPHVSRCIGRNFCMMLNTRRGCRPGEKKQRTKEDEDAS